MTCVLDFVIPAQAGIQAVQPAISTRSSQAGFFFSSITFYTSLNIFGRRRTGSSRVRSFGGSS